MPGLPLNPNPARIVNLSLGGSGACSAASGYPAVIAEVQAGGTVVVAAAGNSAGHAVELPANCPGVIAVAGLRHVGSKVGFSDLGSAIAISAPAGNCINIGANEPCLYPILSSSNSGTQRPNAGGSIWTDSYDYSVGTSFAAPIVAGTAALMLSARPQLEPQEVRTLMQSSARAFPTSGAGNDENGQPVPMCRPPDGSDQLQCYCSDGPVRRGHGRRRGRRAGRRPARWRASTCAPAAPVVGDTLRLSAAGSLVASGRSIVAYDWTLVANPGVVSGFSGCRRSTAEVELPATAAGTVTVSLTVTDDAGQRATVQRSIERAPPRRWPMCRPRRAAAVAAEGRRRCCGSACWRWPSRYCCTAGRAARRRAGEDPRRNDRGHCARTMTRPHRPAFLLTRRGRRAGLAALAWPLQAQTGAER